MLSELGKRCGLQFDAGALNVIADVCGDMPFWMRMAGSYVHRAIDVDTRPYRVSEDQARRLLDEFVAGDGVEVARVALQHLAFVYPEAIKSLGESIDEARPNAKANQLLMRYGLVSGGASGGFVCEMVRAGFAELQHHAAPVSHAAGAAVDQAKLTLLTNSEWAEELALINRRRNLLERTLREQIRSVLRLSSGSKEKWIDRLLKSVSETRRRELAGLVGTTLLERLFWLELKTIVAKNWTEFERLFGDKGRFESAMDICNERPDAHAKPVDAADLALHRRELEWLEGKLE
jgi:hypothetical protein